MGDLLFKFYIKELGQVEIRGTTYEGQVLGTRYEEVLGKESEKWYLVDIKRRSIQWRKEEELKSLGISSDEFELGFNKLLLDIALTNKNYKECERLHELIEEIENKGRVKGE